MRASLLLATATAEFITSCRARNLSPKTVSVYQSQIDRFIRFAFEHLIIEANDCQPSLLRLYFADLLASHPSYHFHCPTANTRQLSPFTVDQAWRTLRTFFSWLVGEHLIDENPMERVQRPHSPKNLVPRLNSVQVLALLKLAKETSKRDYALVVTLLDSGLRLGEILGLRLNDIDYETGRAVVKGKGNKQREVPFSVIACGAILDYIEHERESSLDQIFVTVTGTCLNHNAVQWVLRRFKQRLGLPALYPHLLRHTFAKLYLENGDLKTLQVILGHADISTTAHFYLDPDFDDLKRKHNRASPILQVLGSATVDVV